LVGVQNFTHQTNREMKQIRSWWRKFLRRDTIYVVTHIVGGKRYVVLACHDEMEALEYAERLTEFDGSTFTVDKTELI